MTRVRIRFVVACKEYFVVESSSVVDGGPADTYAATRGEYITRLSQTGKEPLTDSLSSSRSTNSRINTSTRTVRSLV